MYNAVKIVLCLILLQICVTSLAENCRANFFDCGNGRCVSQMWVCDGDNDCGDLSDEKNCTKQNLLPATCLSSQFQCDNGEYCIPYTWLCDGESDCEDETDEKNCSRTLTCAPNEFLCEGMCLDESRKCDGRSDCKDGFDEENCPTAECDEFFCNSTNKCLPWSKICDGRKDCNNLPDEGGLCRKSCLNDNGGCTQICNKSPQGSKCACLSGYRLLSDCKTCGGVGKCLNPGTCSHYCNVKGNFMCSCAEGYFLHDDHRSCRITEGTANFVLLFGNKILVLNQYREVTNIIIQSGNVRGMDYDATDEVFLWTDATKGSVNTYSWNTHQQDILVGHSEKTSFVKYDWIAKNVYFSDDAGNIVVVSRDGKYSSILIKTDVNRVDSMDISPASSFIFWTTWAFAQRFYTTGVIERAEMDGSHRLAIVFENIMYPHSITVDHILEMIYWVDYRLNTIECADFNGLHRRQIMENTVYFSNSLALFEDHVYWADWNINSIIRCEKFNGRNCYIFQKDVGKPIAIMPVHKVLQFNGTNRCLNSGCPQLCLPTRSSFVCRCDGNYFQRNGTCELLSTAYASDGKHNFWKLLAGDVSNRRIFSVRNSVYWLIK